MNLDVFEDRALPHLDAVYRLAMVLSNDPHDSSDLVHATYRRARSLADQIAREGGGFRNRLFRILRSVFAARSGSAAGEPAGLCANGTDNSIEAAIRRFPPEYRSVLFLWGAEGLTYREIADIEDIPVDIVERRLHDARSVLGELLAAKTPSQPVRDGGGNGLGRRVAQMKGMVR